ncbi:hypothetical protein [Simkania negevensis]|uniref:Deubiquitinase Jos2 n=1 Tax=Simkania negevensis (strain ATCC VR-1471 / DSM 27360 / Z) TaxID=331113 RepID=DUBJ2_SIMNZ|nr:hypothetical protein [Simkania negevensis]CCB90068.1 unknown protein [Simkania negevensis Z]
MSAINYTQNNLLGLNSFMQTEEFKSLSTEEKEILTRYAGLEESGTLDERTVVQISRVDDPSIVNRYYSGGGTVGGVVKTLYTDGVELPMFVGGRPYLFFTDPNTHQFYFMKNPDTFSTSVPALEVLDVSAKQWVRIDDLKQLFGHTSDDESNPNASVNYPGLIKAHFLVTQFNQDPGKVAYEQDKIEHKVAEESLTPKNSGEKYYCEEQKNSYCQIHAANAFLGYGAIRPSAIAEYVKMRATGFGHDQVEGLAMGYGPQDTKSAEGLLDIENGVDLGMVVDFMRHLESEDELKKGVSVTNIEVGELAYTEENGLEFVNHETQTRHQVDEEFLAARSRSILGTFIPVHARALRKNTDNSWTEVDSFSPGQAVSKDLRTKLIKTVLQQQNGNSKLTLPCAFM